MGHSILLEAPGRATLSAEAGSDRLVRVAIAASIATMPIVVPQVGGVVAPADAGLALALVAGLLWLGVGGHRVRFPLAVPVTLMVGAGAVAGMLGAYPDLALIAIVQDLTLFAWFVAIANVARTPRLLETTIRAWVWSSVGWAALMIVAVISRWQALAGQAEEGGRAALTFDTPNQAGLYFAVSLLVLLAVRTPRRPVARFVAIGLLGGALLLTASNAALGGTAVALLVALVLRVRRGRGGAVGAVVASGAALLVIGAALFTLVRFDLTEAATSSDVTVVKQTLGRADRSSEGRLSTIDQLSHLYLADGPIGIGPAATRQVLIDRGDSSAKSAHNDHLATLVERGVVGALGLVLLIFAGAWMAASVVRGLHPAFAAVVGQPQYLAGGLVAILLASLTHEVLHFRFVWALLGVIAALHLWGRPAGAGRAKGGDRDALAGARA